MLISEAMEKYKSRHQHYKWRGCMSVWVANFEELRYIMRQIEYESDRARVIVTIRSVQKKRKNQNRKCLPMARVYIQIII